MYNPIFLIIATLRVVLICLSLIIFLIPFIIFNAIFGNNPKRSFAVRRLWVKQARWILGIRGSVEGSAHKDTVLYVCNHRSFSDPLILATYIDTYVIAKAEVENIPLIGKGAKMTGVIYVNRESKDSRSAVRQKMVETLLEDKNVLVYPEGTTNMHYQTKPYKPGTFIEATKNKIPVVPVVLEYKRKKDLWENCGIVKHHFKQFGRLFTRYKIIIGPKMYNQDGIALKEEVETWTNDKIKEIHSNWNSYFNQQLEQTS